MAAVGMTTGDRLEKADNSEELDQRRTPHGMESGLGRGLCGFGMGRMDKLRKFEAGSAFRKESRKKIGLAKMAFENRDVGFVSFLSVTQRGFYLRLRLAPPRVGITRRSPCATFMKVGSALAQFAHVSREMRRARVQKSLKM
jgi:hypothetical protein